jgi:hypothetical protein
MTTQHSPEYIETDINPGLTIAEYRRARPAGPPRLLRRGLIALATLASFAVLVMPMQALAAQADDATFVTATNQLSATIVAGRAQMEASSTAYENTIAGCKGVLAPALPQLVGDEQRQRRLGGQLAKVFVAGYLHATLAPFAADIAGYRAALTAMPQNGTLLRARIGVTQRQWARLASAPDESDLCDTLAVWVTRGLTRRPPAKIARGIAFINSAASRSKAAQRRDRRDSRTTARFRAQAAGEGLDLRPADEAHALLEHQFAVEPLRRFAETAVRGWFGG